MLGTIEAFLDIVPVINVYRRLEPPMYRNDWKLWNDIFVNHDIIIQAQTPNSGGQLFTRMM
jgi:hypothetical protein